MMKINRQPMGSLMRLAADFGGRFHGNLCSSAACRQFRLGTDRQHYGNGGRSGFDGMVEGAASIDCIHHFRFRCGIRLSFDQLYEIEHAKLALWVDAAGLTLASLIPLDPVVGGPLSDFFLCFLSVGGIFCGRADLTAPLFLQRITISRRFSDGRSTY